ncbi:MAG: SMC-Scp complex subunit ScpB [Chloroflexota bacterium]
MGGASAKPTRREVEVLVAEQGEERAPSAPPTNGQLKTLVESLLFVAEGPVPLAKLARTLGVERPAVEEALATLGGEYASRGLRLQRWDGRVQMVTAPEATLYVESFLGVGGEARLSAAALETLAIVAYRQPITRGGLEALRGVNCDRVLSSLQARGLVAEIGRAETAGRPALFATTFAFLEYFGLTDLAELPPFEGLAPAAVLKGEDDNARGPATDP